MASIVLDGLVKRFGEQAVVDHVSLEIAEGELFTLLGPSGCGKTTLLRLLAGFSLPDGGDIFFAGRSIVKTPPHKRETGMVFQNYALFPHLTIFENVAYGLRARNTPQAAVRERVSAILDAVHLDGMGERFPRQLSGGQQQRVALARALVIRPQVLLMDEPLSNLDAKLRVDMREEIRRIQKEFGITTVYVTHDQEEAMAISDRLAILSGGRLQQAGNPWEVYFNPVNRFTAEFMGACTLLEVLPGEEGEGATGRIGRMPVVLDMDTRRRPPFTIMLRPEWIEEAGPENRQNRFTGIVRESTFLGSAIFYQIEALGQIVRVDAPAGGRMIPKRPGESVELFFSPQRPVVLAE
ncbi:MAG: ABC transporter ATP-binding protein [Desulfovibrio sp.]|jgi:iron(III) transport system ATP-binding protein|nr:ABC transporter ATP-binding protein [Desulfovibrio sp.]